MILTGCQRQRSDGVVQRLGALILVQRRRVEQGGTVVVQVAQRVHRLPQDGPHPETQARRNAVHQGKSRQLGAVVNNYLGKSSIKNYLYPLQFNKIAQISTMILNYDYFAIFGYFCFYLITFEYLKMKKSCTNEQVGYRMSSTRVGMLAHLLT